MPNSTVLFYDMLKREREHVKIRRQPDGSFDVMRVSDCFDKRIKRS